MLNVQLMHRSQILLAMVNLNYLMVCCLYSTLTIQSCHHCSDVMGELVICILKAQLSIVQWRK